MKTKEVVFKVTLRFSDEIDINLLDMVEENIYSALEDGKNGRGLAPEVEDCFAYTEEIIVETVNYK